NQSLIHWPSVHVLPHDAQVAFPQDKAGSHYFAAREADADPLRIEPSPREQQFEKFLFYRGVGNFPTPLRVTMPSPNSAILENTSKETMRDLFLLNVQDARAKFVHIATLSPGQSKTILLPSASEPLKTASHQLAAEMASELTAQGLYAREATA